MGQQALVKQQEHGCEHVRHVRRQEQVAKEQERREQGMQARVLAQVPTAQGLVHQAGEQHWEPGPLLAQEREQQARVQHQKQQEQLELVTQVLVTAASGIA